MNEDRAFPFKRVLVALDLSTEGSVRTLDVAAKLVVLGGGEARLVYVRYMIDLALNYVPQRVLQDEEASAVERLRQMAAAAGLPEDRVSVVCPVGRAYPEIIAAAQAFEADLIVVGPHRASMAGMLLGSDAAGVVRHAPTSVLVVR
jgi:nucleotide-binding universal stress UspA family protein